MDPGEDYIDEGRNTKEQRRLTFEDPSESGDDSQSRFYDSEKLPNLKFYRAHDSITGQALKRPTINELKTTPGHTNEVYNQDVLSQSKQKPSKIVKLGWFTGVMIRCLLALFGAILFLRLPWVMGNAGILQGSVIILGSGLISLLTTLSLASVATNGKVKAGGTYFLLSRTLGPDFGGPIGVTIAVADLASSSMVIIGVAVTIQDIMKTSGVENVFLESLNGTRVLGLVVLILLALVILIGLDFESKIMAFMLVVLVVSFVNFIAGWFIVNDTKKKFGFTGFSVDTARTNLYGDYLDGYGFVRVFAVFFPAMTGILAGVNISGNLKNPQKAIPKGTLWATNVATLTYWLFGIASAFIMCRGSSPNSIAYGACTNFQSGNGTTGLKAEIAMVYMSGTKYIVYAGIFAATLSSASAVLVSGPKVFQAVCRDNIFPGFLRFFAVGHPETDEPQRLYMLNFVLSGALICIGELNVVANLLTNFVLLGYAFINFACFYASFSKSPGWRPTFKYYNQYVALFTAVLCMIVMFIVDTVFAAVTILIEICLFLLIKWRSPDANWGSSSDANNYSIGLRLLKSCTVQGIHAKNFRPQCLILSGWPEQRLPLIHLINRITKSHSLTICGNVITDESVPLQEIQNSILKVREMFAVQKIHAFYTPVTDSSFRHGVRALMQCAGFGVIRPNILVMGFKKDWMTTDPTSTIEYFQIIHDTFDISMSIVIAMLTDPLTDADYTMQIDEEDDGDLDVITQNDESVDTELDKGIFVNENLDDAIAIPMRHSTSSGPKGSGQFIDIWWLFDDGGLTVLFPYLLSTRKRWRDSRLRIFIPCLGDSQKRYRKMAHMLNEFRIPYESIQTITDLFSSPSQTLTERYYKLIEPMRSNASQVQEGLPTLHIKDKELTVNQRNIEYFIKLRELLTIHSKESRIIFVTMPIPREQEVSAGLYLSWLEFISKDMPSIMFIRGNQENVLTYYT